ncbi:ArsR/SmtB family transcription factor [Lentilactobacillus sp. SPB1-3]|uniref:ArsR/SmtB family transcription factor n=1 Tax=Lentilactobacillus terminaliae TaxID=3003483 RepID=A0ACD5DDG0_9LACO|nr:metalloregulator ArsR/SmtB family transcription factor [Lentilactobacillus sp. SPB1-3]MCZ0977751.1 metalloregulator ArsR/SmtB family transcription factor [Lentilactobacillus sp. SPB1-3]
MQDLSVIQSKLTNLSDFLVALGDEKRQAILIELMAAENGIEGLRVTDLTEATNLSRPAISHHIKILMQAKLIERRSEGTKNYYYLSHDLTQINQLQDLISNVKTIIKESGRE